MSICYYDSLNFGDELGPVVSKRLLENHVGCSAASLPVLNLFSGDGVKEEDTTCLFVLGSVFHMVKEGDHVWGIGVNPSHFRAGTLPKSLTLHSVRGPLTSNFIKKEGFNIALKTILFPWAIRVFCCLLFLVWQNLMALLQTTQECASLYIRTTWAILLFGNHPQMFT
mmetsp:Transcript_3899/g.6654  ORF Transcript_3899/g.6654 Transcript_3899/m.6654 type:complete len:168 (-) Transcript_3899:2242-2745(-)